MISLLLTVHLSKSRNISFPYGCCNRPTTRSYRRFNPTFMEHIMGKKVTLMTFIMEHIGVLSRISVTSTLATLIFFRFIGLFGFITLRLGVTGDIFPCFSFCTKYISHTMNYASWGLLLWIRLILTESTFVTCYLTIRVQFKIDDYGPRLMIVVH